MFPLYSNFSLNYKFNYKVNHREKARRTIFVTVESKVPFSTVDEERNRGGEISFVIEGWSR